MENFFLKGGPDLLEDFINKKPSYLEESLFSIVPVSLHQSLHIKDWGWVHSLIDENDGILTRVANEILDDISQLEQVRDRLIKEQRPSDYILRLIKTLKNKPLLNFLSTRNILPKYGFPVDVVELKLMQEESNQLELERDLRIALSEYAPSSEVVAGGKLWVSRYIKRSPKRKKGEWEWERFQYAICDYCKSYNRRRAELDERITHCSNCKRILATSNRGTFIMPSYGFIASRDTPTIPGDSRPEKTFTTRIYYSGDAKQKSMVTVDLNSLILTATPATHGKMAVINDAGRKRFKICSSCGYALIGDEKVKKGTHYSPWGNKCNVTFRKYSLGHEFETDLIQLLFSNYQNEDQGFWYSLLYGLLEGCSEALSIERQDLDGVLYYIDGDPSRPAIVLYDDVPGGAGHVLRIAQEMNLRKIIESTLIRMKRCECGGVKADASCYGCLRHYRNQFCHELLNRGKVINFIESII